MTRNCILLLSALIISTLHLASTAYSGPMPAQNAAHAPDAASSAPVPDTAAVRNAIGQVGPALVRILSVNATYDQGREIKRVATGSGVIITAGGHVITNHHVVGTARQISCTLADRTEVEAELMGTDPLTDIAVIRLRPREARQFTFAVFGDSSTLEVGDPVLAMGSPLALSQSITRGVVSNMEMTLPRAFWPFNRLRLEGEDIGSSVRWIGHDARIFPGNSGGPLVNLRGEIIGINEIVLGIGGAIPGNLAREVAERLIGSDLIERSWTGIEFQPLLKNSGWQQGVLVSSIIPGSPGEKAGIRSGDRVLALNGVPVTVKFPEELPLLAQRIERLPVGRPSEFTVVRETGTYKIEVTPRQREYRQPRPRELRKWGITGRDLSALGAKEMRREDDKGVLVTSLRPGGPASTANPRLSVNDVIVMLEGKPVANIKELAALTDTLLKERTAPMDALVTFDRNRQRMLTVLKLGSKDLDDPGIEVKKAWLPVAVQGLTREISGKLGITHKAGMIITQIYPDTGISRLGLQTGDVILKVDGEAVPMATPGETESFQALIRRYRIGTPVDLTLWRDGKEYKVTVPLSESPRATRELKRYSDELFDFTVRDIAFLDRAEETWDADRRGVLVETVGEGGWASLAQLAVGDLIVGVDGEEIEGVKGFEALMKDKAPKKPKSIVLKVWRGIYSLFVELQPAWNSNH